MDVLVDTSVLISLERDRSGLEGILERTDGRSVAVSAITASELLHGVERAESARRRARRERFVESILELVPVLPFDLAVARVHAVVWADLQARGDVIGAHDLVIAATALCHEMPLATRNVTEFDRIEGLEILADW